MGIKRYYATQENTITNAFKDNLITRGTGSNMGASDILEVFVIHGQTGAAINAGNAEQTRVILKFPIDQLVTDIDSGAVPSGSLEYRLKLYNAPHAATTPLSYSLDVEMVSQSWTEGRGLDMENYSDLGASNWIQYSEGNAWTTEGGDVHAGTLNSSSIFFETGLENLDVDVAFAVDQWRAASGYAGTSKSNYGFRIRNTLGAISGSEGTLYTKKFFGRGSEYFLYRPVLEVRWDSSRQDNRGNFALSSSLAAGPQNLNTLYMYNTILGQLQNIPDLVGDTLTLEIYSGSAAVASVPTGSALLIQDYVKGSANHVTGGLLVENGVTFTGIYTASYASTSALDPVFDIWSTGSGGSRVEFYTGSYVPQVVSATSLIYNTQYISTITNLKSSYMRGDNPRMRLFARKKDWKPNIYTVASEAIVPRVIEEAHYRIYRTIDDMDIIPFATGSVKYTKMAYDISGNYFDLDTSILEKGYSYGIGLMYYINGQYIEQPETFKFRVDEAN